MWICLDSPGLILTLIPNFKRQRWKKLYLLSNLSLPLFFLTKAAAMFTSAERWSDRWRGRAVATHPPCTLSCFRQKPRHLKRKQCETVFRQSRDTSDWSIRNSADFDQTLIKRDHFLNMIKRFRVSLPIFSEISALTDEFPWWEINLSVERTCAEMRSQRWNGGCFYLCRSVCRNAGFSLWCPVLRVIWISASSR